MAVKRSFHHWRQWRIDTQWDPKEIVSEEELLDRVILAKALIAYCSHTTVHFRTEKENLEITPSVARDVMRAAGMKLNRKQMG